MKASELNVKAMTRNIVAVYNAATKEDIVAGADWYPAARLEIDRIASETGIQHATIAGIIAALSPQLRWTVNVLSAETVIRGEIPRAVLRSSVRKAVRILSGETPESVLSGPKVNSFYRNLMGDDDCITVDTHAASAAMHKPIGKSGIRSNIYAIIATSYREASESIGMPPATLQAIVWVTWRNQFYARNKAWKLHKLEKK